MIKRAIIGASIAAIFCGGIAFAQDEPAKDPAIVAPVSQSWSLSSRDKAQILDAEADKAAVDARREAVDRHDAAAKQAAQEEAVAAEDLTTTNNIRFNTAPLAASLGRQFADTPYDYRYGKDCLDIEGIGWHICQRELDIIRRGSPYETNDLFYRKGIPAVGSPR